MGKKEIETERREVRDYQSSVYRIVIFTKRLRRKDKDYMDDSDYRGKRSETKD